MSGGTAVLVFAGAARLLWEPGRREGVTASVGNPVPKSAIPDRLLGCVTRERGRLRLIPVGSELLWPAIAPVWAGGLRRQLGGGSISVVNVAGGAVSRTIQLGGRPYVLAVSPDGRTVYAGMEGPGVEVIRRATKESRSSRWRSRAGMAAAHEKLPTSHRALPRAPRGDRHRHRRGPRGSAQAHARATEAGRLHRHIVRQGRHEAGPRPTGRCNDLDPDLRVVQGRLRRRLPPRRHAPMGEGKGPGVLGDRPKAKAHTYCGIGGTGCASHAERTVHGRTWSYASKETMGGKAFGSRFISRETSGTLHTFEGGCGRTARSGTPRWRRRRTSRAPLAAAHSHAGRPPSHQLAGGRRREQGRGEGLRRRAV